MTNEPNEPNESNEPIATVRSPEPRRGGLPGWAWALIGGGAWVMIAIVVIVVIEIGRASGRERVF